jgi:hypothetical protein
MIKPKESIVSCGDTSCEILVSPIPRPKAQRFNVSTRPRKRRVALVDTRKPNSQAILRSVQAILRSKGIDVVEEILTKSDSSRPMANTMLDEIAKDDGLILCGVAD